MLWQNLEFSFNCCIVVNLVITLCAFLAYYVNSKRPDDDPKKRDYHPLAILFAPITLPLVVILGVSFYILRVATYGVFLVLYILALIFFRKPFILEWLKRTALKIGDLLMEVNSALVRIFLPPLAGSREAV